MPRVKGGSASDNKRKRLFKLAKGYFGRKGHTFKRANEQMLHSLSYAYRDRKAKKREFRRLWILRINAAAHQFGMNYSCLINGLKIAGIQVNRKMLAGLAVNDLQAFGELATVAKGVLPR